MALSGLVRFEERLQVIQKYQPDLELRWVVPTFVDGRVKKSNEILTQLRKRYGDLVSDPIKYSVKASEAPAYGKTVFEHDPRGTAAEGYNQLTDRIIRDCEQREVVMAEVKKKDKPPLAQATPLPQTKPLSGTPPMDQRIMRQLKEAEQTGPVPEARPVPMEPAATVQAATEKPLPKPRLTRQDLVEKLLDIKESVSPRSRAKFTWVIDRLENSDRNWTEVDLRQIDQLIDKMVRSDRAASRQAQTGSLHAQGAESTGPLNTRLQWSPPAPGPGEELPRFQAGLGRPRNAGTAGS